MLKKLWINFIKSDFIKTFKEELIIIPLLLLGFYLLNYLLMILFPNGAFFDFFSQLENIVNKILLLFISLWTAHLALRISFPKVYKYLHEEFYNNFDNLTSEAKMRYTVSFILIFILTAGLVFKGVGAENPSLRNELVQTLESQLGVRENPPNSNRGQAIDLYLRTVGSTPPNPWCVAFVGSNLYWCGIPNPKTAWSPDYANKKDIIWTYTNPHSKKPLAGDVTTYYYSNIERVGHGGFYIKTDSDGYFITIEGNTNGLGSREGDGVYKKKHSQYQVHAITRYIK